MAKKLDIKSVEEEKDTPWYIRVIMAAFFCVFFAGSLFLTYKLGNFICSDDFFWKSENRIYLSIGLWFLWIILVCLGIILFAKIDSLIIHNKKCKVSPTGLRMSVRDIGNRNIIVDSEYYDRTPSPTKMKKLIEDIVKREKRKLN